MVKITFSNPPSVDVPPKELKDIVLGLISPVIKSVKKKNPKDKIGIIIGIAAEESDGRDRIENDLIRDLNSYLNSNKLSGVFNIIKLNDSECKTVNNQNWQKIVEKYKAHLIVYGFVKKRNIDGKENYSLKLYAGILHNPIPVLLSKSISSEFATLFPRKRYFPASEDLLGFEITAEWLAFVVEYMVGIAFFVSGNLGASFKIFEDIDEKIQSVKTNNALEVLNLIKSKNGERLVEVSLSICNILYTSYSYKRDLDFVGEFKKYIDVIESHSPDEKRVKHYESIYFFLIEKNIGKAIQAEKQTDDSIKPYNMGFLAFFEGKLNDGIRYYQNGSKRDVPLKVLIDLEAFMTDTLTEYPEKIQFYFSKGVINYKGKGDFGVALEDFRKFLQITKNSPTNFLELRRLALIYIDEIRKQK